MTSLYFRVLSRLRDISTNYLPLKLPILDVALFMSCDATRAIYFTSGSLGVELKLKKHNWGNMIARNFRKTAFFARFLVFPIYTLIVFHEINNAKFEKYDNTYPWKNWVPSFSNISQSFILPRPIRIKHCTAVVQSMGNLTLKLNYELLNKMCLSGNHDNVLLSLLLLLIFA